MKKTILFCTLLSIQSLIYSQDNKNERIYPNEIGLNTTEFIKSFFSFNNQFSGFEPYLVSYKRILNGNQSAIRFFAGGSYINNKSKTDSKPNDKNYTRNFEAKIGYERRYNLSSKFTAVVGADIKVGSLNTEIFNTGSNTSNNFYQTQEQKNKTGYLGINIPVGLYFHLNKRLSLYTEAGLSVIKSDNSSFNRNISYNNRIPNVNFLNNTHQSGDKINVTLPINIFLFFRL